MGTAFQDQEFSEIKSQIKPTTRNRKTESIIAQESFEIWIASISFKPSIISFFEHCTLSKSSLIFHDGESVADDDLKKKKKSTFFRICKCAC